MAQRKVTIIECDRCHEEVDPELFATEGSQVGVKPMGPRARTRVWDLCPSCRVLHARFLEMKPGDN